MSPHEALGLVRLMRFLLEADDPDAVLARAVAALGLLPEIAWAELDGTAIGDLAVTLGEPGATRQLSVGLAAPNDIGAHALVEGVLDLVVGVYTRDVAMRRLEADAATDPLTSLWNRRGFEPLLDHAIARAIRTGEDIALVVVDVDRFKSINDELGHAIGDRALVAIAEAVRAVIRPTDVAARLGGDELAILLSGANGAGALKMCERLRIAIANVNPLAPRPLTLSIGVADMLAIPRSTNAETARLAFFEAADIALYAAKAAGRDRAVCHVSASRHATSETAVCVAVIDDEPTMPICVGM
jgi:diguanylate cyclase (GGDEF)-like protein